MKVSKILESYKLQYEKKQQAKAEGITYKELLDREAGVTKKKSLVKGKKKSKGVEIVIKMKGEDGKVETFDESNPVSQRTNSNDDSDPTGKENVSDA